MTGGICSYSCPEKKTKVTGIVVVWNLSKMMASCLLIWQLLYCMYYELDLYCFLWPVPLYVTNIWLSCFWFRQPVSLCFPSSLLLFLSVSSESITFWIFLSTFQTIFSVLSRESKPCTAVNHCLSSCQHFSMTARREEKRFNNPSPRGKTMMLANIRLTEENSLS